MKCLELTFLVILLGTLRVCQGLTCTPETDNTCVKSLLVTGNCVQSVCECVSGAVPNNFGCHYSFKPTINVRYPFGWSGELHTDGHIFMECLPAGFGDENYKWYQNGTLLDEKSNDLLVKQPVGFYEYECVANAYGTDSVKSDPLVVTVEDRYTPFREKPVVVGMPTSVALNASINLACENVPATYNWYKWHINYDDGQKEALQPDGLSRTVTIVMTADRFDSTVTCTMDHMISILNVESDPVETPKSPADDIPGVVVEGENEFYQSDTLNVACQIDGSFVASPHDVITYTWEGPDGNPIDGETSQIFVKGWLDVADSGVYKCTASYNGKPAKTSPDFVVTVKSSANRNMPIIDSIPKRAVVGGYIAFICSLEGHDPSTLDFSWKFMSAKHGFSMMPLSHYTDNVLQINDINSDSLGGIAYLCYVTNGYSGSFVYAYPPVNITGAITPMLTKLEDESTADTFVLSCNSDYATPGTEYQWFIDNVQEGDLTQEKIKIKTGLKFKEVTCRIAFNGGTSGPSHPFDVPAQS